MKKNPQPRITYHARRILRFLKSQRRHISPLLILTHDFPDPDALASAFALKYIAKEYYGITSQIAYGGILGRMENRAMVDLLKMPVRPFRAKDLRTYSHVALVDTQPAFANNSFPDTRRATIVIDQHSSDKKIPADLFIRDEACGATCVILARCLVLLKAKIPASLATALAYGILSDTLNFYRCKFPQVIETYLKILPFSDLGLLAHIQNPSRSRKFFTTLSKAIRSATAYGPVMVSHIGRVENPDLVSQVCDFLLTYEDAQWSLCTGRFRQTLHMSLRGHHPSSKASLILRNVVPEKSQAGGHATIAGGAFRVQRRGKKVLWSTAEQEIERNLLHELGQPRVKRPLYPFDGNGG